MVSTVRRAAVAAAALAAAAVLVSTIRQPPRSGVPADAPELAAHPIQLGESGPIAAPAPLIRAAGDRESRGALAATARRGDPEVLVSAAEAAGVRLLVAAARDERIAGALAGAEAPGGDSGLPPPDVIVVEPLEPPTPIPF